MTARPGALPVAQLEPCCGIARVDTGQRLEGRDGTVFVPGFA